MRKTILVVAVITGVVWAARRAQKKNDQAWFWSDEWQDGEREATEEIERGNLTSTAPENMFPDLNVGA